MRPDLHDATQLALQRTVLAAERTFLAWVRTALSMIGFGFTIYKFFQYLYQTGDSVRPHAPRNFGITLIALGTLTLVTAAFQHQRALRDLGIPRSSRRIWMAIGIALLMALIGVLLVMSISLGEGPF